MKRKPNLVIIHSFPTNSKILAGFYEFLEDYFTVYPVDLPGFVCHKKPLDDITLKGYADHVKSEIDRTGIKKYWLAGVSFGFVIANLASHERDCKGIMAIEPYLDRHSLRMPRTKRMVYRLFLKTIRTLSYFDKIWQNELFQKNFLTDTSAKMSGKISAIIKKIDARTFFRTAELIITAGHKECVFYNKPYILIINPKDTTVRVEYILNRFKNETKNLLIAHTTASHFPKEITKTYFKKHVALEEIKKVKEFVLAHYN